MATKNRNSGPDVPYHLTFATYKKDETDLEPENKRRHKKRCIHYEKESDRCSATISGCYNVKCHGSNQCAYYAETLDECKSLKLTYYRYRNRYRSDENDKYMQDIKKAVVERNIAQKLLHEKQLEKRMEERTEKQREKNLKTAPTSFQLTCKFFDNGNCLVLGKEKKCEMKKSCLFHDTVK